MHRQKVGIKRFPIFLYVVLLTEDRLFYFFLNTNTETLIFLSATAADTKEGCPWLQKD